MVPGRAYGEGTSRSCRAWSGSGNDGGHISGTRKGLVSIGGISFANYLNDALTNICSPAACMS